MVRAHHDLTRPLSNGNDTVLIGRGGRLFYLGDEAVRQSAGLLVRDKRVSDTVAMLKRINAALAARGIRFTSPFRQTARRFTRTSFPLGRKTVDGAPSTTYFSTGLRPMASGWSTFAHRSKPRAPRDRFSTCMIRIGPLAARSRGSTPSSKPIPHPDWRIDPEAALGPMTIREGTDLARMLGIRRPDNGKGRNVDPAVRAKNIHGDRSRLCRKPLRLYHDIGPPRAHDHDLGRFVYPRFLRPNAPSACRT